MASAHPPSDPRRYEEIRAKLLERGYLGGPLERFLLRDLAAAGSPARAVMGAAARASLLGAPIVGGLLAGAAVAANRPLLSATDALLLWLYLSLAAGFTLLVGNIGAAFVVAAMASRRGAQASDALRAALVVGLPLIAYLAVLGSGHRPQLGAPQDLLFLGAALAATLLVAWLAGLVSLAGIIGRTGEVPDRSRRGVLTLVLALLPAAGLSFVASTSLHSSAAVEASAFIPAPSKARFLLVGVDGLDGGLVQALEARDALPRLLEAMARGAVYPTRRPANLEPPEVWTTILTGMPSSMHGVRSVSSELLPGVTAPLRAERGPLALTAALRFLLPTRTVPTSGSARRVRTLSEIVALKEPSIAVGWWASWPVLESERGYVVTDRVLPKLLSGAGEDRDAAPQALFERLRRDFDGDRKAIRDEFERLIPVANSERDRRVLWESFLIDAYAWRTTSRLLEDPAVRAAFVYLPGLDIVRGRLSSDAVSRRTDERLADDAALEAYVRWLDGLLGDAMDEHARGSVVLVADPGREATPETEGFVVVQGSAAKGGCVGPPLGDLDVVPVALRLLGYPQSAEMPGRFPPTCLEAPSTTIITTFGRRELSDSPGSSDYDPEMVERLRSLGYVE